VSIIISPVSRVAIMYFVMFFAVLLSMFAPQATLVVCKLTLLLISLLLLLFIVTTMMMMNKDYEK